MSFFSSTQLSIPHHEYSYLRRLKEPEGDPGESVGGGAAEAEVHQQLGGVHLARVEHAVHAAHKKKEEQVEGKMARGNRRQI